ncbi:molybdenum ABC transporter permease [Paraglaciecola hydrolytica]|uniref:Molybdenum ABC transporter permease n=1 Tax=Paraglaciecola hydrolytica TaxID=1799789 RepID=A0A148KNV3_9ALTE|nr:molybdenum ABC transporter permease [Paraglaciecola hydrolytica]
MNSGNRKFTRSAIALALSAILPIGLSHAQEVKELAVSQATAQTEDSYKVDQSTSDKYPLPLLDTAKTITVISQSVMKDRNVDNLRDALRNVPGISMAAGEGGAPPGDSMSIRGFDASNDIFIDGIRDLAGYSRDTYNTESIEVSKGPGSTTNGRGSAGGSINMQTKTAKLEEFADVTARIGTESDYRATVDFNTKLGEQTALRINLLAEDGDVAGRNNVSNESQAIAASLMTQLTADSNLSLNADVLNQDNVPDYGIPWVSDVSEGPLAAYANSTPPVNFDNFYGNLYRDFEDIDAKSFTLKYENQLSASTKLIAKARTASVDRVNVVTAPRFISVSDSTDVRMSDEKTRDTSNSINIVQVDLQGTYVISGMTHNVVAGTEFAKEKFERWGYVALVADNLNDTPVLNDLFDPNPYLEFTGQYGRDGSRTFADGTGKAVYVVDNIELNSQWIVGLGLRWDDFDTEYHNDSADLASYITTDSKELSWNANISYKPSQNSTIYVSAGTSFTPLASDLTGGVSGNQNNANPEKNTSIELGSKWELFKGRAIATAAIFQNTKIDGSYRDADDRNLYYFDGEQKVTGLELSVIGQVTDELSVTAGYTYQDTEVVNDLDDNVGLSLARSPKNSASLWARYDFNDQLAAGLGLEYVGERNNGNTSTSRTADSYTLFDMMVSYQATEKLSINLNGSNITDEDYVDQLGGGHFIPGTGRLITLGATYSF